MKHNYATTNKPSCDNTGAYLRASCSKEKTTKKRDTSVALESCAGKPTRMENKGSYSRENDLNLSLVFKKTNIAFIKHS